MSPDIQRPGAGFGAIASALPRPDGNFRCMAVGRGVESSPVPDPDPYPDPDPAQGGLYRIGSIVRCGARPGKEAAQASHARRILHPA